MNKPRPVFALVLILVLTAVTRGEDAVLITIPPDPLAPGEYAQLMVTGLAETELAGAKVDWSPKQGVVLIPARSWGGAPFLLFSAKSPGTYTITITLNGWVFSLASVVSEARGVGVDAQFMATLNGALQAAQQAYPYRAGKTVVTVKSTLPPPKLEITLPAQLNEGAQSTGTTVITNRPDLTQINLSSSSPRVTVPATAAPGPFLITAPQNPDVDGNTSVTVTATAETATVRSQLEVIDDDGQPPPGPREITVIYETEENRPAFVQATQQLRDYCAKHAHTFRMLDDDTKDPDGKVPPWLQTIFNQIGAAGVAIPALVVSVQWQDKTWFKVFAFPDTGPKSIKLVQEAGG